MTVSNNNPQASDLNVKRERVRAAVRNAGADGIILATDVHIFYMTGLVFNGYYYLPVEGEPQWFVKRPSGLAGEGVRYIRKPEEIPALLAEAGIASPGKLLVETGVLPYNECVRLQAALQTGSMINATTVMRSLRMIKSEWEIERMRLSAAAHADTYRNIPDCYRQGMTDLMFQIEIERQMRLHGSMGVFRVFGPFMNVFMGSILAGENAGTPSPFDFALGGGGQSPLSPIGANGTPLREGTAIMVDMAGNFTEYLTDMTRVFSVGRLPEKAYYAHSVALEIQDAVCAAARPGASCAELYNISLSIAGKAGLAGCFMGIWQQAKFVGHGIGLEINEPPVMTPRSSEVLEAGMTFALEPKFVIPGVGAVGIENSFLVTATSVEKLTVFEEEIIRLE
jgi:Xaa-Pro aminopeptidase